MFLKMGDVFQPVEETRLTWHSSTLIKLTFRFWMAFWTFSSLMVSIEHNIILAWDDCKLGMISSEDILEMLQTGIFHFLQVNSIWCSIDSSGGITIPKPSESKKHYIPCLQCLWCLISYEIKNSNKQITWKLFYYK